MTLETQFLLGKFRVLLMTFNCSAQNSVKYNFPKSNLKSAPLLNDFKV